MSATGRNGIACGGNWIIDRVKLIDHYPAEESVAGILDETMGGGGCGHNMTLNLAKLDPDLPVTAAGLIGEDPDGDWILRECAGHPNIRTEQLKRTASAKTSYTDVFSVLHTGRRTFFHDRGANRLFGPESVDIRKIDAAIFHLGYLLLLDEMDRPDPAYGRVSARFLKSLQEQGIRTSIDLVSADVPDFADIVLPALKYTDYCIINDYESERLTGMPVRRDGRPCLENLASCASRILDDGVRELAVIHFPEGAFAAARSGETRYQPSLDLPPDFIRGSTGAGDSFCAGMLYGLHEGWRLEACLELAVCAGGRNLQDLTTTGSITHWQETLKLRNRFPYRRI
ncbi:carbohydrate kinase family protein [bacterium]|nr:carbohydrate kinase family protein [bacterium]